MINFMGVPQWVSDSFPTILAVVISLIAVLAIGIIICILVLPSNPDGGSNVITGTNDSYYAQNKSSNKEGRLKRVIIICAVAVLVLAVCYFILFKIYRGN